MTAAGPLRGAARCFAVFALAACGVRVSLGDLPSDGADASVSAEGGFGKSDADTVPADGDPAADAFPEPDAEVDAFDDSSFDAFID